MKNTKKNGQVRYLIFQEPDGGYCAVCLDFDIIEWGTNKKALTISIREAANSYLQGVIESNLPDELLNRPAPRKYWKMLDTLTRFEVPKSSPILSMPSINLYFGFESSAYNDRFSFA